MLQGSLFLSSQVSFFKFPNAIIENIHRATHIKYETKYDTVTARLIVFCGRIGYTKPQRKFHPNLFHTKPFSIDKEFFNGLNNYSIPTCFVNFDEFFRGSDLLLRHIRMSYIPYMTPGINLAT